MALYLDIAQGEEVTIGEGSEQVTIRADRKNRRQIRIGVTVSARETIEIRIGDAIVCAAQEEGRRVQLKLEANRSIPIHRGKNPGSGGPPKP
ncbi:MAG: hypothetical protein ACYC9I_08430 [Desulfuromonadales bacterium]